MIQICAVETEHGCICYQLERKNVRNINLRIRTDASVYVSAPKDVSESVVTQFVKRRSRYIAEAQQHFREFQPLEHACQNVNMKLNWIINCIMGNLRYSYW